MHSFLLPDAPLAQRSARTKARTTQCIVLTASDYDPGPCASYNVMNVHARANVIHRELANYLDAARGSKIFFQNYVVAVISIKSLDRMGLCHMACSHKTPMFRLEVFQCFKVST